MSSQNKRNDHDEGPSTRAKLVAIAGAIVVALIAVWFVIYFQKQRALDDCINSGRRNCVPLDMSK